MPISIDQPGDALDGDLRLLNYGLQMNWSEPVPIVSDID